MKVYQFNMDNGIYAGELFEDEEQLKYVDGVTALPPPPYDNGHVPVFDRQVRVWNLIPREIVTLRQAGENNR